VVVEAAPQSGSLITARLAAEQGREVMAVPGSPLDPRHKGTNGLLREGATLVETAADVLEALAPLLARPLATVARPRVREPDRPDPREPQAARSPTPESRPTVPADGSLAAVVESRLGHEPLAVDELVRQCGAARLAEVQDVLLDLELDGRLDRHPGNRVALRAG
jgi:DNA processing protein